MKPRILLVDDDPHVTAGLQRSLRKEPYEIFTAHSADEALQLLEQQPVDVIVSDEKMPGMSGSELLARVHQSYPDIVRIILSGQASIEAALRAINEAEVYRFLTKPCNSADLTGAIEHGLEWREREAGNHSAGTIHSPQGSTGIPSDSRLPVSIGAQKSAQIILDETGIDLGTLLQALPLTFRFTEGQA
jgi:DNA-binding NtrC family response regulator